MNTHSSYCQMSHYVPSYTNDAQSLKDNVDQNLKIDAFKEKFLFKPFEYQQSLELTVKHQIKSLNPKKTQQEHIFLQNQLNKNKVQFFEVSKNDSFMQTSKSIKTNKTIWGAEFINSISQGKTSKNSKSKSPKFFNKNDNFLKPPKYQKSDYPSRKQNSASKNLEKDVNAVAFNNRSLVKKSLYNKEKYDQNQKNRQQKSNNSYRKPTKNYFNFIDSEETSKNQIDQSSISMCQSIAMGSMMVQNFIASTFQAGFLHSQGVNNQPQSSRRQQNLLEPLNFYSLCMLLFPQNPRSVPCPVFIIDTLFYNVTNQSKQIIYVFKDRRRNLLIKMKNKGKNAFDLFLKRRQIYQISKAKGDKISKSGPLNGNKKVSLYDHENLSTNEMSFKQKNDRLSLDEQIENQNLQNYLNQQRQKNNTQASCFEMIAQDVKNKYQMMMDQNQDGIFKHEDQVMNFDQQSEENEQFQNEGKKRSQKLSEDVISLVSQKSMSDFKQKLTKLSFQNTFKKFMTEKTQKQSEIKNPFSFDTVVEQNPIITPSNSVRQSFHSLQTHYMSLLKYNNGQFIRLKAHEFKAIYQNPLYANERFKNNNNTQYIQTLPVEDQFKDIKVYSMHFHYELFKNQPLFLHVKNSLYKQNEYMTGMSRNYFQQADKNHNKFSRSQGSNNNISIERKNNLLLKRKLKLQNIQVYLYYQIFQIYTYASMHYNKQIMNGIFRFIDYDKDFALFQTQNVVVKQMPQDAQFIRAKIFNENAQQNFQQKEFKMLKQVQNKNPHFYPQNQDFDETQNQTPSQTIKKITTQMLKLSVEPISEQSQVQKTISSYFTEQNVKIKSEMQNYFNEKIEKIKNIKDMDLSKNVFKVINGISDQKKDSQQSWANYGKKNQGPIDFHDILNDDKKLRKFLKEKQKNDLYSRKNISNFSIVRCQKEVDKVRQQKKAVIQKQMQKQKQNSSQTPNQLIDRNVFVNNFQFSNRPQTAKTVKFLYSDSRPNSVCNYTSVNSIKNFTKTNRSFMSCQKDKATENESKRLLKNSQSLKTFSNNQVLLGERPMSGKQHVNFEKKLINERYTQFNKSKFKLNGFKTDKFI